MNPICAIDAPFPARIICYAATLISRYIDRVEQGDVVVVCRHNPPVAEKLQPFHKDPFARMLMAQAIMIGLAIVTSDRAFGPYPVRVIWQRLIGRQLRTRDSGQFWAVENSRPT
jgi:antitoxin (DNA-binding transcriptional repressor) of toxin-antitoxin stability system